MSKFTCREILDCIRITASGINKLDWRIASTVIQSGKPEEWVACMARKPLYLKEKQNLKPQVDVGHFKTPAGRVYLNLCLKDANQKPVMHVSISGLLKWERNQKKQRATQLQCTVVITVSAIGINGMTRVSIAGNEKILTFWYLKIEVVLEPIIRQTRMGVVSTRSV
jgi:hypothetical protein